MQVALIDLTPFGSTAAANTSVVVTITGVAGKRIRLASVILGYTAAAPAAPVMATIADGTTTMQIPINTNPVTLTGPFVFATAATVTITLPTGGASAVGGVSGGYWIDNP